MRTHRVNSKNSTLRYCRSGSKTHSSARVQQDNLQRITQASGAGESWTMSMRSLFGKKIVQVVATTAGTALNVMLDLRGNVVTGQGYHKPGSHVDFY